MKKYLIVLLLLWSPSLFGMTFEEYISSTGYEDVNNTITQKEINELSKINRTSGSLTYNDKLIKLYLIGSEINEEPRFSRYIDQFEGLVSKARQSSDRKGLSGYNQAEWLLHFLHDELFKIEITGSGAGYNIGIQETLDEHLFNCYKSALIYNAFLEYFGYQTYLVLVPEHIYSVVYIDGTPVEVETTNAYGFDPHNRGLPKYTRKFDNPNIKFDEPRYSVTQPIDNISVISIIYNSRLLLYTGQKKYQGVNTGINMKRAAALGLIGLYISPDDKSIANNVQFPFFTITKNQILTSPGNFESEYERFYSLIQKPEIKSSNAPYLRNLSILLMDSLKPIRTYRYGNLSTKGLDAITKAFSESLLLLEKYSLDNDVTDAAWNNTVIEYLETLETRIHFSAVTDTETFARQCMNLFNNEKLQSSTYAPKYRKTAERTVTVHLNNYVAQLIESGQYAKAVKDADTGIIILKKQLDFYDNEVMRSIELNRDNAKKAIR